MTTYTVYTGDPAEGAPLMSTSAPPSGDYPHGTPCEEWGRWIAQLQQRSVFPPEPRH
jgi:hypothetical protein